MRRPGSTKIGADRSSPNGLRSKEFSSAQPVVVADGEPVGKALRDAIADGVDVVITSGGTGISPSDQHPRPDRGGARLHDSRAG